MEKSVEANNLGSDVNSNRTWWPACWRKCGFLAGLPTQSVTPA